MTVPTPGSATRPLHEDPPTGRARTAATERTYAEDWSRFELWCTAMACRALPAEPAVLMFYLGHLAPSWRPATAIDPPDAVNSRGEVCESPGLAPATLVRHLSAIGAHHVAAGYANPSRSLLVTDMLARIRDRAADPTIRRRVAPVIPGQIRSLVAKMATGRSADRTIDRDPVASRDAAMILLGYAAALRPAEIAALTLDQVREDPAGEWIEVLSHPAEPEGQGPSATSTRITAVGGEACPVATWRRWRSWLPDVPPEVGAEPGAAGVPAFRAIRKGRPGPDDPAAYAASRQRIAEAALTTRSVARIVSGRADQAGLLGHWTAGTLSRREIAT